jgi:predicted component of type VI protein secretion system
MPAAKLRDLRDTAKGKTYKVKRGVTRVGRARDNDVVLPFETVSAHHALIEWRDGAFYVKDLASTNGTRRNGTLFSDGERREIRSVRVKHRDRIAFDNHEFEFLVAAAEQAAETVIGGALPSGTVEVRVARPAAAESPKATPAAPHAGGAAGSASSSNGSPDEDVTRIKPQPQKCTEHPSCDATERCAECGRAGCEWCVTEKNGKVICRDCAQLAA